MTKIELVKTISEKTGYNQKEVTAFLDIYRQIILDTLAKDANNNVPFPGIGNFKIKNVKEKSGLIQLGENKGGTWTKPAHNELTLKITESLKDV